MHSVAVCPVIHCGPLVVDYSDALTSTDDRLKATGSFVRKFDTFLPFCSMFLNPPVIEMIFNFYYLVDIFNYMNYFVCRPLCVHLESHISNN